MAYRPEDENSVEMSEVYVSLTTGAVVAVIIIIIIIITIAVTTTIIKHQRFRHVRVLSWLMQGHAHFALLCGRPLEVL